LAIVIISLGGEDRPVLSCVAVVAVLLHAFHPNREDVHEAQALGVLGEHGRE
jgi:hypothetical protein